MALVIKPTQQYSDIVTFLENIGLTDVVLVNTTNYYYEVTFKFPDGTQVVKAHIKLSNSFFVICDLEAHIIVFINPTYLSRRYAPDMYLQNYAHMCVLPTSTGAVIDLYAKTTDRDTMCEVFNIMEDPDYSETSNPSNTILLPAYVGLSTEVFEIPNCYVSLNATHIPGTKYVDETGAKWVALFGSLLYKVPTTD